MTPEDGERMAGWRYPGPWAVYDVTDPLDPAEGFWVVEDDGGPAGEGGGGGGEGDEDVEDVEGGAGGAGGAGGNDGGTGRTEVVGYACFGTEARVPGLAERPGVLDVGVGMRPDLTGQGRGRPFAEAVLEHGRELAGASRLRAVVQDWNSRSIRLLEGLGFAATGEHLVGERRFVVLERDA
jgi:RimJ/RimL family protein N-acetyltransferase